MKEFFFEGLPPVGQSDKGIFSFFFSLVVCGGRSRSANSRNDVSEKNGATNSLSNDQIDIVLQPKSQMIC